MTHVLFYNIYHLTKNYTLRNPLLLIEVSVMSRSLSWNRPIVPFFWIDHCLTSQTNISQRSGDIRGKSYEKLEKLSDVCS